jgi:hypothetical protein
MVLVAAVLLGAAIGELPVFKQTTLGTPKLPAASLARFLGYGGALVIFALLARRVTGQLRQSANGTAHLAFLVVPLAGLIVLSLGYDVLLAILHPFLGAAHRTLYNWLFVFGISACAVWLVAALYRHAEGLTELIRAVPRAPLSCGSCGAAIQAQARFCAACGSAAAT